MFCFFFLFLLSDHPGKGFQNWPMKMDSIALLAVKLRPGLLVLSLKSFMTCKSLFWLIWWNFCSLIIGHKWTLGFILQGKCPVLHNHLSCVLTFKDAECQQLLCPVTVGLGLFSENQAIDDKIKLQCTLNAETFSKEQF